MTIYLNRYIYSQEQQSFGIKLAIANERELGCFKSPNLFIVTANSSSKRVTFLFLLFFRQLETRVRAAEEEDEKGA